MPLVKNSLRVDDGHISDFFAEPQRSMVDICVKLFGLSQDARIQRLLSTHLHTFYNWLVSHAYLPRKRKIKESPGFATVICIRLFTSQQPVPVQYALLGPRPSAMSSSRPTEMLCFESLHLSSFNVAIVDFVQDELASRKSLGNSSCALKLGKYHRYRRSQSIGGRLCTPKAVI